jgi:hypothetical protein
MAMIIYGIQDGMNRYQEEVLVKGDREEDWREMDEGFAILEELFGEGEIHNDSDGLREGWYWVRGMERAVGLYEVRNDNTRDRKERALLVAAKYVDRLQPGEEYISKELKEAIKQYTGE